MDTWKDHILSARNTRIYKL